LSFINKKTLFLVLCLPFIYIVFSFANDDIVDITDFLYEVTGNTAIFMLFATTLASVVKKVKFRKMLGLFTFFYAFVHFMVFAFFDYQFDINEIIKETTDKPFIYLGSISFIILSILAITSFKSLFKRFIKIHKLIYVAIILTFIHSMMSEKTISLEALPFVLVFIIVVGLKIMQYKKRSKN
jgi:sulfoxide reductase heme-binding subunit YedZ